MPSAGLLSLPLELLDEVTDYVAASPQEILTLRCVNKAFCSLVTPAAFRKIVVHTTDESAQGFLELLVSTDIAKHVRVIQIIEDPVLFDSETERYEDERFKRVGIRLRGVCFMLHLIPSLESLTITFFPDEDASWKNPFSYNDDLTRYHFFQWDLLGGLACNPNPLPALQSLQIDNWFAYPDDLYAAAPFQRIVASLRDLRFLVQDTDYKSDLDHFPAEDFWPDVIWHRVLRPAVNLESLSMSCSLEFGSLIRLDLGSVTFPQLSSLSLSNFVWDDVRVDAQVVVLEAEDFIVRHGKTLKKLELQSCTICVPRDGPTLVRSWAAVWNRFADKLTELVDLVVEYNFNQRYVCFLQEYGFDSNSVYVLRGTEEDTPALEALVTIVKGRQKGRGYLL
ncbi:hypothetical protein EDB85DRAFT_1522656 [Lactarius pseudohatsudake]|nr:hypothetical protein EDB85DRAFT_1522656 [Lactarius pseudohatsudake]